MKRDLNMIALEVFKTCIFFDIKIEIEWVPKENVNLQFADFLSKEVSDPDDWQVADYFFLQKKSGEE